MAERGRHPVLGSIAAGSFRETRILKPRPDASWSCTNASGRAVNSLRTSSFSRPTRKPVFRRAAERRPLYPPNPVLVHGPVHASWLNQIEIYFSIIQRKVLTPNDFSSRQELVGRLLAFERHYETIARPFQWRFTRHNLTRLLRRLGHPAVKAA